MADTRSRSASPPGDEPRPKKQKTGGFKWKEKKPRGEDVPRDRDFGRLERGYRDRSPRRDSYRDRGRGWERDHDQGDKHDRDRDREGGRRRGDAYRDNDRFGDRREGGTSSRPSGERTKEDAQRGGRRHSPGSPSRDQGRPKADSSQPTKPDKPEKKKKPKVAPVSSEPMIVVNVNDRLGTKAAIPCLASDSIKSFKAMVAAHIGRAPHEILLKRQGERPFKDQLTLEDYGVSNGVQLDLELDTGD